MSRYFTVIESKNCVNYTKRKYHLSQKTGQSFLEAFGFYGKPEVTDVQRFLPSSNNLFKIRSYEFSFELSGAFASDSILVVYKKNDISTMDLVEASIDEWAQKAI